MQPILLLFLCLVIHHGSSQPPEGPSHRLKVLNIQVRVTVRYWEKSFSICALPAFIWTALSSAQWTRTFWTHPVVLQPKEIKKKRSVKEILLNLNNKLNLKNKTTGAWQLKIFCACVPSNLQPIHARFAFTHRVIDPHTDPEANYREWMEKKDRSGPTERRKTKSYKLKARALLRMNGPFTHNLGCLWRRNYSNQWLKLSGRQWDWLHFGHAEFLILIGELISSQSHWPVFGCCRSVSLSSVFEPVPNLSRCETGCVRQLPLLPGIRVRVLQVPLS